MLKKAFSINGGVFWLYAMRLMQFIVRLAVQLVASLAPLGWYVLGIVAYGYLVLAIPSRGWLPKAMRMLGKKKLKLFWEAMTLSSFVFLLRYTSMSVKTLDFWQQITPLQRRTLMRRTKKTSDYSEKAFAVMRRSQANLLEMGLSEEQIHLHDWSMDGVPWALTSFGILREAYQKNEDIQKTFKRLQGRHRFIIALEHLGIDALLLAKEPWQRMEFAHLALDIVLQRGIAFFSELQELKSIYALYMISLGISCEDVRALPLEKEPFAQDLCCFFAKQLGLWQPLSTLKTDVESWCLFSDGYLKKAHSYPLSQQQKNRFSWCCQWVQRAPGDVYEALKVLEERKILDVPKMMALEKRMGTEKMRSFLIWLSRVPKEHDSFLRTCSETSLERDYNLEYALRLYRESLIARHAKKAYPDNKDILSAYCEQLSLTLEEKATDMRPRLNVLEIRDAFWCDLYFRIRRFKEKMLQKVSLSKILSALQDEVWQCIHHLHCFVLQCYDASLEKADVHDILRRRVREIVKERGTYEVVDGPCEKACLLQEVLFDGSGVVAASSSLNFRSPLTEEGRAFYQALWEHSPSSHRWDYWGKSGKKGIALRIYGKHCLWLGADIWVQKPGERTWTETPKKKPSP